MKIEFRKIEDPDLEGHVGLRISSNPTVITIWAGQGNEHITVSPSVEDLAAELRGDRRAVAFGAIATVTGWGTVGITQQGTNKLVEEKCQVLGARECTFIDNDSTLPFDAAQISGTYLGIIGPLALVVGGFGFLSNWRKMQATRSNQ